MSVKAARLNCILMTQPFRFDILLSRNEWQIRQYHIGNAYSRAVFIKVYISRLYETYVKKKHHSSR